MENQQRDFQLDEIEKNKPSQEDRILSMLQLSAWVCGTSFLKEYMPTYSQRIAGLRKKGYDIKSEKCDNLQHTHSGNVAQYKWNDYNGWCNYETWNVALWINNDEQLYKFAKKCGTFKKFIELIYTHYWSHVFAENFSLKIVEIDKIRLRFDVITMDGVSFKDNAINKKEMESMFQEIYGG